MKTMKKILAFALAGVMHWPCLRAAAPGARPPTRALQRLWRNYDNGHERKTAITYTSSAELDAKLQQLATKPGLKLLSRRFTTATTPFSREFASNLLRFPHPL